MHKRTVSYELHTPPFHPQKHTPTQLKTSAFIPHYFEKTTTSGSKPADFVTIKDKSDKNPIKNRCKTDYEDSWAPTHTKSSYKMDRYRQLQEMKSSNIDNLNNKIKSLINKLTAQSSMNSSAIFDNDSKIRLKTDYSTNFRQKQQLQTSYLGNQQIVFGNFESRGMFQSTVFSQNSQLNMLEADKNKHRKKNEELALIRLKYKSNSILMPSKNSLTLAEGSGRQKEESQFMVKQKNKLKLKKQIYSTKKQTFFTNQKQNLPSASPLNKKKDINEEFSNYEKKLESYNMKRKALLNQCQKIHILGELSQNSSFLRPQQSFYDTLNDKEPKMCPQQFKIYEEGEGQLPTADFRKIQDSDTFHIFLTGLMNQIKFDEQFRKAKKWLSRYPQNLKWTEIDSEIKQRMIDLDQLSVRQIFTLREQEESPFYSFREADFTVKKVVDAFVQSEEHWFENLVKKFNKKSLQQNGLNQKLLDFSGRGYICVEDFVRLLNIEMNAQVRNRDLFLIFERLRGEDKLTFQDLMQVICH